MLACQLVRKSWHANYATFVRCADTSQAEAMSTLLWSVRPHFFMPHNLYQDNPMAPIVLGFNDELVQPNSLLINLAPDVPQPTQIKHAARIIELVCQAPDVLQQSRLNFRHYRTLGYSPQRVEL